MPWNLCMKTLGGLQFWSDVWFHPPGYRIQRNLWTSHYRLLDQHDWRLAWGSLAECHQRLEQEVQRKETPSLSAWPSAEVVVLIHGICRTSHCFRRMRRQLQQEGYHPFRFSYPSTRRPIGWFAADLHSCLQSLAGARRIHFVTHSMGGLVLRAYFQHYQLPQLGRSVMLGPPHFGAHLADLFRNNPLYWLIYGPAGQQLTTKPDSYASTLPLLPGEFGIIAGGRGKDRGYNPCIPGDNDGMVELSSTRLPGAVDWMRVCGLHAWLMNYQEVLDATVCFLRKGWFRTGAPPEPIRATHGH